MTKAVPIEFAVETLRSHFYPQPAILTVEIGQDAYGYMIDVEVSQSEYRTLKLTTIGEWPSSWMGYVLYYKVVDRDPRPQYEDRMYEL